MGWAYGEAFWIGGLPAAFPPAQGEAYGELVDAGFAYGELVDAGFDAGAVACSAMVFCRLGGSRRIGSSAGRGGPFGIPWDIPG